MIDGKSISSFIQPARTESDTPTKYRFIKRLDGTLVLQGAYFWQTGFNTHGYEWRDIPTVLEEEV